MLIRIRKRDGKLKSMIYRFRKKPAAEFIRLHSDISGPPDTWVGRELLDEISFGLAGCGKKLFPREMSLT